MIIATRIFSSGHIFTSRPNRREATKLFSFSKEQKKKQNCQTKINEKSSLAIAISLCFSPISSAFWNADAVIILQIYPSSSLSLSLVRPVRDDVVQNRTTTLDSPISFLFLPFVDNLFILFSFSIRIDHQTIHLNQQHSSNNQPKYCSFKL